MEKFIHKFSKEIYLLLNKGQLILMIVYWTNYNNGSKKTKNSWVAYLVTETKYNINRRLIKNE